MAGRLRSLKFIGLLTITASCFTPAVQHLASIPTEVNMAAGDTISIPLSGSAPGRMTSTDRQIVRASVTSSSSISVTSSHPGNAQLRTTLFGFIPWKTRVHVIPSTKVMVGGQAVGIRLQSKGPIVVGFRRLADGNSPSAKAHVQVGDMIVSINKKVVHTAVDLQVALNSSDEPVHLTVERGNAEKQIDVTCSQHTNGKHQLGLYVRDRTVGVGTLTFYDPEHHTFGALGHVITDTDTGQRVVGTGSIYNAVITGVKPGTVGAPGEKRGTFSPQSPEVGHIADNTPYGIFGQMSTPPSMDKTLVQIALPEQVHEGPAKMLTVLHAQTVEAFDVRIENVARQNSPSTKSMIIKVVDPRLLSETGGIIQGMSGSPLVQDGRLIGAVTHVFVSDPTRGYGVYALWMMHQTQAYSGQNTHETWSRQMLWSQHTTAV